MQILFVIDGRVTVSYSDEKFGLGPVLDTLRDRFAWWVRFTVDVVNRDGPDGFRFTQRGFNLDEFDQAWFFGDWPGEIANDPNIGDDIIEQPEYSPLDDEELRVLADWMDRGGGVFATGDHSLLGASMCHRIPRVRTMRKWTRAQGVPSFGEDDRHETLQHAPGGGYGSWEGDRWPQTIVPVRQRDTRWPFTFGDFPHPLLCGHDGVIDHFPDHMHEGAVIETDDVVLDEALDIPGYEGVEYPSAPLIVDPTIATALEPRGPQPRPQTIAHAWTTTPGVDHKRFALIGVYDGDPVNVGRVVVDSTWHHWFSMNLNGFRDEVPAFYRGMQDYYRNVALWLATPEQRASMLFAATWGTLVGKQPGLFSRALSIWDLGERVVDAIGRTAPQCIIRELVATFLPTETRSDPDQQALRAASLRPTVDLVNQAILGGVALGLVDMANHYNVEQVRGHLIALDVDALRSGGLAGVSDGQRELIAVLADGASKLGALSNQLTRQLERPNLEAIPVDREPVDLDDAGEAPDDPIAAAKR